MYKCLQRKTKLYFGSNGESRAVYFAPYMLNFVGSLSSLPILQSKNFWQYSSLNAQLFAYIQYIQLHISRDSVTRKENITTFCFTVFMWNALTWNLVVVVFAYKIILSNIAHDGCGPRHCSWGTANLLCFKFQLVTLNKTKIICSVNARKLFIACGVKILPVIVYNTNIPDIFQVFMLL